MRDSGTNWMVDAACKGTPTNIFFPGTGQNATEAKSICGTCPVADECLEYALADPDLQGIFGGMSVKQRRKIRATAYRRGYRLQPKPIDHGTSAGYRAHQGRGESACADCLHAHREHMRWAKQQRRAGEAS